MNNKIFGLDGLGLMSRALGERLIANGGRVLGYDVATSATAGFQVAGGTVAPDAKTVFGSCETFLLSLPTDNEVNTLLHQAADSLRAGQIILDTTTCHPANSIAIAREVTVRHLHYLDATISGNSEQLRRGETLWMVGGPREAFDSAPICSVCWHEKPSTPGPQAPAPN